MTEIYHGSWSPMLGDIKVKVPDVYHRYPVSSQVKMETERQPVKVEQAVAQPK